MSTEPRVDVLDAMIHEARLPPVLDVTVLRGRGFDNQVLLAALQGGRQVIARVFPSPRQPEVERFGFLAAHEVPAPALLASIERGSLYEFVDGRLLGDLIDGGADDDSLWQRVGGAFRVVHDIEFPSGIAGDVHPDRIELHLAPDSVVAIVPVLERAQITLEPFAPTACESIPLLCDLVEAADHLLRAGPSSLLHGDVNMWNVIASDADVRLIDWDSPAVGDPRREIALLDKHASLFNGTGLPPAFFAGYGRDRDVAISLLRLVGTVQWAASSDWESFERKALPPELSSRVRGWRQALLDQLEGIEAWIDDLAGQL